MNIKKGTILTMILFICSSLFFSSLDVFAAAGDYTLLESIPGGAAKGSTGEFGSYMKDLFNFAVGFVVIAALLMVTIGGFYYITSAGNQAQAGTAKKIITDALLGLVVVFVTYLILYTINPDLVGSSPNMKQLQSAAANPTNSNTLSPQSTAHTNNRVVTTSKQPQTYCSSSGNLTTCFNSQDECEAAGGDCKSSQNSLSNSKYYQCVGRVCTSYNSQQDCRRDAKASCQSGSSVKARMTNNVESSEQLTEKIEDTGGAVSEDAEKEMNNATEKTFENMKEVVKETGGGTVASVDQNGAQYGMEGAKNNGTPEAQASATVKGLKDLYKEGEADGTVVRTSETVGKVPNQKTYYKYEFSPDHPNEKLRGTTAIYFKRGYHDGSDEMSTEYSDVQITAAQEIKPKTEE